MTDISNNPDVPAEAHAVQPSVWNGVWNSFRACAKTGWGIVYICVALGSLAADVLITIKTDAVCIGYTAGWLFGFILLPFPAAILRGIRRKASPLLGGVFSVGGLFVFAMLKAALSRAHGGHFSSGGSLLIVAAAICAYRILAWETSFDGQRADGMIRDDR